ncbi:hypothetical protein N482_18525 [Pseudoalteromonas luteoviolacea NCIMB 1942]|uniref:Uncharacterized protein n=1 Tax=Pseudoalteromonas luteoviolacea NCIMB 1942 TaxID=1365253 RepID=A0A166Z4C3_9GAMM|nr:hypothetical protein N482_18525 [Pseudoalteromonas luteoviolacea NCIMB 1942]
MTHVILKPQVEWQAGNSVIVKTLNLLHHQPHEACFLANSVNTDTQIKPK